MGFTVHCSLYLLMPAAQLQDSLGAAPPAPFAWSQCIIFTPTFPTLHVHLLFNMFPQPSSLYFLYLHTLTSSFFSICSAFYFFIFPVFTFSHFHVFSLFMILPFFFHVYIVIFSFPQFYVSGFSFTSLCISLFSCLYVSYISKNFDCSISFIIFFFHV
jgi:hypothetical protein